MAVAGKITSYGMEYCETESHSTPNSPITNNTYNFNISDSPGASIVNQSQNVQINNRINDISKLLEDILKTIEQDRTIHIETKKEIESLIAEIKSSLQENQVPNNKIKSLLNIISSISSVSSFVISLLAIL